MKVVTLIAPMKSFAQAEELAVRLSTQYGVNAVPDENRIVANYILTDEGKMLERP